MRKSRGGGSLTLPNPRVGRRVHRDPNMSLREDALDIWRSAVAAVRPADLVRAALTDPAQPLHDMLRHAARVLVVGAGKAGAAMCAGVEAALADSPAPVVGLVNVPAQPETTGPGPAPPGRIQLHVARPAGTNQPTAAGVAGSEQILHLVRTAQPDDVCLCLLSGGGSALLPAPGEGTKLEDKQTVTRLLHECGATINEMNTVRKHLSRIKGGRLAAAFTGRALFSLIISDVIGDPLDVIASGPTAPDATTYADALDVLARYQLQARIPLSVATHLNQGRAGAISETPKTLPPSIHNLILGNNARALAVAEAHARRLGYAVVNLGSFLDGETRHLAAALAGVVRAIKADGTPVRPPACLLSGGETTVTLVPHHGRGGRNQEFVLALADKLGREGLERVVVLSGGTDGEDGPTDAAGAVADARTLELASQLGLQTSAALAVNDAYAFFAATGDLLKTGLTGTNVMDVRVVLIE